MTSKTSGRTIRRRVAAGGVLAAVVALAVWLSQHLGGFGLGLGSGGTGDGKTSNDDASKSKTAIAPPKKTPSGVVEVRVDKQGGYLVKHSESGKDSFRPVAIERILSLAKQAPGDDRGVKVRIHRRVESLEAAIARLKRELLQAGLKRHDIDEPNDEFR